MYCSSCGGAVARSLDYCNHCGARLVNVKDRSRATPAELFPESLIWAIVAVFTVGLGAIIGLMAVMKEVVHFDMGLIIAFTALSFTLVFAVESVLIWQLVRRRTDRKDNTDVTRIDRQTTKELDAVPVRALPDPVPSVTEQTTRAFEPVYNERKSN
jgi:predicted amidophosphoribosyltransferase